MTMIDNYILEITIVATIAWVYYLLRNRNKIKRRIKRDYQFIGLIYVPGEPYFT
jgi:UDP-N-acetyl-D-mannosaminuronic acid transferase (WecB/TagA/CpsF family)